ncbi:putative transferase, protein kinase RLK-Pelle-RKF3 family [Helianthus annuus]|uniref:non-specific serine/threonine protein kinase n=1 Tax=Helianthus annuus TaxID=4232 RepID=A0A251URT7_HELAN|nr:probable receptor-like protein kinase At1g11050 [Helianthus annuus]KAF5806303.1 putative transferase, protein kinase RLK-Pelle-RKF3 family [Helianthus annuus]KAJ0570590.1 putative transferase, protein kinase RLK-Pelle-RKF3 family [Helianthus annuus]KAJ0577462.1 putative transferase, protein kinase RLK-Pelle-RKF3 family [Helianthus annuus]KAJ0584933.1 putative transferase, protein kinase RLK-Pelle-RKF3 family [Helianthus annuus]KAJ0750598.1 putative transferase, protein kinase RLK-Pelle-RKF3
MKKHPLSFLIVLCIFSYLSHSTNSSLCPIDFNYVNTFPWDISDCSTTATATATENCCSSLRGLFRIGLAHHLKKTKTFYLPNPQSSASCISDFQSRLSSISVAHPLSTCHSSTNEFVASPSNCDGIVTLLDWVDRIGPNTVLQSSCDGDLAEFLRCRSCLEARMDVNSNLVSLSQNSSKCLAFTALYAAGIVNSYGPDDIQTAKCILGISLSKSRSNSRSKENTIYAVLGALIGTLVFVGASGIYRRYNNKRKETQSHRDYVRDVKARVLPNTGAKWFCIAELDVATNRFSQQNLIGQGGFGVVYKGTLSDGTLVAVKKMMSFDAQADNDFVNEAEIISKIRHRNLLPLRGFCATSDPIQGNERYLVYDYMPNGSLHDHIFDKSTSNHKRLSWPQRKSIILDVAKGLSYLHNEIKPAIFHRDIKATNILLDSNMRALVADFGLAKQSRDGQSWITTRVAGTYGYVAPEYALYGQLTSKIDVYSFGIIVLEIMSGRKVIEEVKGVNLGMVLIADWAWEMVKSDRIEEVFDDSLKGEGTLPKGMMARFVRVGLVCAHALVALRPTISEALKMLEGDIDIPPLLDRPAPFFHDPFRSSFRHSNSLWLSSEGSMANSSVNNQI